MSSASSDQELAAYRLRSHIRAQSKEREETKASAGKSKSGDISGSKDSELNMDQLLIHIKEAQEKTEQSLMKAIELSKKELKADMEDMTSTLRESVGSIRVDLNRIEETFGPKIQCLQNDLEKVDNQLKVTVGKVSSLEEVNKEKIREKTAMLNRIKVAEEEITALKKSHKTEFENLRKEIRGHVYEQKEQMVSQAAKIDTLHENTLENVDQIKMIASGNSSEIRYLADQVESLDNKARRESIVVDGLPEKDNEESDRDLLVQYIQKIIPDFRATYIEVFYRVGKPPKKQRINKKRTIPARENDEPSGSQNLPPDSEASLSNSDSTTANAEAEPNANGSGGGDLRRGRPAMVGLSSNKWRDLILSKASDIRANTGVKGFWINRDQNDNSRRKHQLVKACYNLLVANEYPCSIKGSIITMRGMQYDYEKLYLLPDLCTPFHVKTRGTVDGKGLCFQSEHVFCSNFAPSILKYDGYTYKSVEHAYQCTKARDAGYSELAEDMRAMRNSYKVKKLGSELSIGKKWKAQSEQLMNDLIQAKFDQDPNLREKLLDVPYRKFYEMTGDRLWATGRRISKTDKLIDVADLKAGKNLVGQAITRVKNGYILEEVRAGRREPDQVHIEGSISEQEDISGESSTEDVSSTSTVTSAE